MKHEIPKIGVLSSLKTFMVLVIIASSRICFLEYSTDVHKVLPFG